jgi:hypothetical protein
MIRLRKEEREEDIRPANIVIEKSKGITPLGRLRRRRNNIRIDARERWSEGSKLINLKSYRGQ